MNTGQSSPIDFAKLDVSEQVKLINQALEPQVYPALEMDGGGMEIMDIERYNVLIQYYGACGGCPISETATLPFIQQTLQSEIDPRIVVSVVENELDEHGEPQFKTAPPTPRPIEEDADDEEDEAIREVLRNL